MGRNGAELALNDQGEIHRIRRSHYSARYEIAYLPQSPGKHDRKSGGYYCSGYVPSAGRGGRDLAAADPGQAHGQRQILADADAEIRRYPLNAASGAAGEGAGE